MMGPLSAEHARSKPRSGSKDMGLVQRVIKPLQLLLMFLD